MSNRLIMFIISVVCLVFIVNISRSIYSLWQKGSYVTEREQVKAKLQQENAELETGLKEAESPEFIEREAREKLNLQKSGETVVILPQDLKLSQPQVTKEAVVPNWQRWRRLIIN